MLAAPWPRPEHLQAPEVSAGPERLAPGPAGELRFWSARLGKGGANTAGGCRCVPICLPIRPLASYLHSRPNYRTKANPSFISEKTVGPWKGHCMRLTVPQFPQL